MKIHLKTGDVVACKDHSLNEVGRRIGSCFFCRQLLSGKTDANYELFLNEANHTLLERSDYVGLAPCGSRFKGYATEDSDFDVLLIAGDGTVITEHKLGNRLKEIAAKFGKTSDCLPFCYTNLYFKVNLASPTSSSQYAYDHAVWPLLCPLRGKTLLIQQLRMMAKRKHQEYLSKWPKAALDNIKHIVVNVIYHEWGLHIHVTREGLCTVTPPIGECPNNHSITIEKCLARGLTKQAIKHGVERRGYLWWQRAISILGHAQ